MGVVKRVAVLLYALGVSASAPAAATPAVRLVSPEATVWLGRTQVVPFRVAVTGRLLDDESNLAALELLTSAAGNRDRRLMDVAAFIGATPEASLW